MPETFNVTCTCDDFTDDPCPMHGRENALQDENIRFKNAVRAFVSEHESRRVLQPIWNDKHIDVFKQLLENKP